MSVLCRALCVALAAACAFGAAADAPTAVGSSRLLIHVPAHASLGDSQLKNFLHSAFAHKPVLPVGAQQRFDVLVVLSGNASDFQKSRARGVLSGALDVYAPAAKGFVECLPLVNDKYDRLRTSADWSAGPNAEFYEVMHESGRLYDLHTKRYRYVLQMETDVVTFADGWLTTLIQPVHDGSAFLISGARLRDGSCISDEVSGVCNPVARAPAFIRGHINGNALYNMNGKLQQLLNHSLLSHTDWPFDLAAWLSAEDLQCAHLLHDNQRFINVAHPLAADLAHVKRAQQQLDFVAAGEVVFAHVPFRLRLSGLQAALVALDSTVPVTLTFVSSSHLVLFRNLLDSLTKQDINNVLIIAFDDACFHEVRRISPAHYQVVANISATEGSTQFKSSAFLELVNSRQAVITDVLRAGYSVFSVDVDVIVQHNYVSVLQTLPPDRTYFSSDGIAAYGYHFYGESSPRYFFNAGVFFVPKNNTRDALRLLSAWMTQIKVTGEADQDLLNKMVNCTQLRSCFVGNSPLRVGLLEPTLFQNGANLMSRGWPSAEYGKRAFVIHNNWADGFGAKRYRFQTLGMWARELSVRCANMTVFEHVDGVRLSSSSLPQQMARYLAFFSHVRDGAFSCAVVPCFHMEGISGKLPFDVLFDFNKVAAFTRAQLFPTLDWVSLAGGTDVNVWAASGDDILPLPFAVDDLLLAASLMSTFSWVHHAIDGPYTCVQDAVRSIGQVAVTALRPGGLDAVLRAALALGSVGHKVFLAGKWRILHEQIDNAAVQLITSTSRHVFPPHEHVAFGLPFAHGRFGEDVMFDVLDLLVCKSAAAQRMLAADAFPVWNVPRLLAEVARHIPATVLEEDLAVLASRPSDAQDRLLGCRLLFSLEDLRTNGFSNRVGTMQALLFLSEELDLSCAMPPFQPFHNGESTAPWVDVLNVSSFYAAFERAVPPSVLLLLQPSTLLAYLIDGAQLPVLRHAAREVLLPAKLEAAFQLVAQHSRAHTGQSYGMLYVSSHAEYFRLRGKVAMRPRHAYLGMTDAESHAAFAFFPSDADVGMPTTFRTAYFKKDLPHHIDFAQKWRSSFLPSEKVGAKSDATIDAMSRPFACVHLRLLDEYLEHHKSLPHGNRTHVLHLFQQFASAQVAGGTQNIYVAADTDIRAWASTALPTHLRLRVHMCFDFGCPAIFGADSVQGVVDASVCTAADVFRGNIYSSYTLHICARRNDQSCEDLFGRTISDNRLLI
jgi:hypothetical protein